MVKHWKEYMFFRQDMPTSENQNKQTNNKNKIVILVNISLLCVALRWPLILALVVLEEKKHESNLRTLRVSTGRLKWIREYDTLV